MSTSRGSTTRNRPQKHQNRTAFKNNLHDTSGKTKFLNTLEISGVCQRCKDIIDWKIKYKKYKMLTAPKKCANCGNKTVKQAYHVLCGPCAKEKKVCAKCCKNSETEQEVHEQNKAVNVDISAMLKLLPERKRRTILRCVQKNGGEHTPEIIAKIEDLLEKLEGTGLSDLDESDSENGSDEDDDEQ